MKIWAFNFCITSPNFCYEDYSDIIYIRSSKLSNIFLWQIKNLPSNNRPRFLGLTASPIKATNAVSARSELWTFLGGFPSQTRILRPELTSLETPHSATSVEWLQVHLSTSQTQLCKKIFDVFKVQIQQCNLDLPPTWIESPESMSICIPQIRGALRNLPTDKWKPGMNEFKSSKNKPRSAILRCL